VLIVRDVLGFTARETADIIGSSEEAVAMTLSRARTTLRQHTPSPEARPPGRNAPEERMAAAWPRPWPHMITTRW